MSSSEEKTEEMDQQKISDKSATPSLTSHTEVGSENTESMLRNILEKVSVLDDMCQKLNVISEKVEKIEANLENSTLDCQI